MRIVKQGPHRRGGPLRSYIDPVPSVFLRRSLLKIFRPTPPLGQPLDKGFSLATVVAWLRQHTRVPVLTGLPFGHVPTKVALPVGAKVALAVEGRDALMLWGHIH